MGISKKKQKKKQKKNTCLLQNKDLHIVKVVRSCFV